MRKFSEETLEMVEYVASLGFSESEIKRFFHIKKRDFEALLAEENNTQFKQAYARGLAKYRESMSRLIVKRVLEIRADFLAQGKYASFLDTFL